MSRSWQNDAVFLTDGERILFSSNSSLTDALTSEQLSASAEGEALTDGSALYLSPSAMFGFSYGVVCRSDAVQAELSSLRTVMTVFMLAALAGISLLTALISRWNYQPVRQYLTKIALKCRMDAVDCRFIFPLANKELRVCNSLLNGV